MRRDRWLPADDAVSPVIGVVLLVGIAVTLMATIGIFVLGAGPGDTAPRGEVQFSQQGGNLTVTVVDGAGLFADDISIIVDSDDACLDDADGDWSGSLEPGDDVVVYGKVPGTCDPLASGDDTVRVVWSPDGSARTDVVARHDVF